MWSSLKQVIKSKHDKCIIVENGKPSYVVMSFEEYQHLQESLNNSMVDERFVDDAEVEDSLNSELSAGSYEERDKNNFFDKEEHRDDKYRRNDYSSSISIEDLPF